MILEFSSVLLPGARKRVIPHGRTMAIVLGKQMIILLVKTMIVPHVKMMVVLPLFTGVLTRQNTMFLPVLLTVLLLHIY